MGGTDFKKEETIEFARFYGFGFYRVSKEGEFVECDPRARKIFGIPENESNLSIYSIKDLYVAPAERKLRIDKLMKDQCEPLTSTLYLRLKGESKLLLDICRYDDSYQDKGYFVGLISEIEESTMFPQMFETFPMGLYEVDEEDRVVRANEKLVDMLKYKNKDGILKRHVKEFCEDEERLMQFNSAVKEQGFAHDILRLRNANDKIIEVECFSQMINEFGKARWGMMSDVTERMRYVRAVEKMPTGYYYIECAEKDENHEHERLIQCNDRFARILGFENKEDAIGINLVERFHPDKEVSRNFFRDLYKADKRHEALLNYPFITNKVSGETIHISIDAHLVKDSSGRVIGREGTIRDITEEIELKNRVKETEERLERTTADINKLIHTFLHPVIKFAGNSELMYQVGSILHQAIQPKRTSLPDGKELTDMLMTRLIEIRDTLPDIKKNISYEREQDTLHKDGGLDPLIVSHLKERLTKIINVFDYSLQTVESKILLDSTIRDTALWILEELNKIEYFKHNKLKSVIGEDFIEFLQGILFNHLVHSAKILMAETEVMKREVEALRAYIGLKKERKLSFVKRDIGIILEENIERFTPILSEKEIEIEYKRSGNLELELSPNDIDRVICNLFHNAKKYSYAGKGRFVKVRARELQPDNLVEFSIESFGIAIKKDEIESGYIYKFGSRGELAFKSDRDGTGVGLTDARDIIEAHGGKLDITSRPAGDESDPPEYKVPYLTKVTIRIPRVRNRKEE